jgi:murein DD-endopeptidase MepM/ murein hydrolase activator NlpD
MPLRTTILLLTSLMLLTPVFATVTEPWPRTAARPAEATPDVPPGQASGLPPPESPLSRPGRFHWPLAPPHPVVRPFQRPTTPYGPGHRGVDLGGQPDDPVLTAGAGVVVFAGPVAGRGVVSIDHAGGIRTTYEPLAVLVTAGQRVDPGTVIAHLAPGHEGCVEAPACLHWGARRGEEYVDPLGLLSTGRVRLLPWDG